LLGRADSVNVPMAILLHAIIVRDGFSYEVKEVILIPHQLCITRNGIGYWFYGKGRN